MIVTVIRCDRCSERIAEGKPYHKIKWGETTKGAGLLEPRDFLVADLCEQCYHTVVEMDLSQYSRKEEKNVQRDSQ